MASKKHKKSYHHGDLRAALLRHAVQILAVQGSHELSLRALAREAGVSHAAPYRHFADKAQLMAAVAQEGFENLKQAIEGAGAAAPAGALERFYAGGEAYVRFAVEHPAHYRVMFAWEGREKARPETLIQAGRRAFEVLLTHVASLQQSGVLPPGDPLPFAQDIWSAEHGLAMLYIDGQLMAPDPPLPLRSRRLHEALLMGLGKSKPAVPPSTHERKPPRKPGALDG
jgi:AcrR family transcriptional regulator